MEEALEITEVKAVLDELVRMGAIEEHYDSVCEQSAYSVTPKGKRLLKLLPFHQEAANGAN
jgi:predicted transcriptional regulator